jgi:hypothetical protein
VIGHEVTTPRDTTLNALAPHSHCFRQMTEASQRAQLDQKRNLYCFHHSKLESPTRDVAVYLPGTTGVIRMFWRRHLKSIFEM